MIEAVTFEHVVLSVLANGVGLCVVMLMRSAPPRMVLYVCLAGMSAICVPWTAFGNGVTESVLVDVDIELPNGGVSNLVVPSEAATSSFAPAIILLWITVGLGWTTCTIVRSGRTRRKWRSISSGGSSLAEQAHPSFAKELRRARIRRLPNTSSVFSTGLWRPEIWIGERLRKDSQIQVALNHELCHIAFNDQVTLLLVVVAERLLWWNPLIWLLGKRARRQMEYACDARCQELLGRATYRRSLAEILLGHQQRSAALEVPLGGFSDVITRMEKIEMTHSFKVRHAFALLVGGSLVAAASTGLAAQENAGRPTLIQCHDLLPEDVQYDFVIKSDIDTRQGRKGELSVTLLDASRPDSHEVPEGAGEFLQCVRKVIGAGNDEDWPEV